MTLEQYAVNIDNLLPQVNQLAVQKVIVPAANELLANLKNRIIREGKNSSQQTIGNYSTKSAYFTRDQFDRRSSFKPTGKTGKKSFKDGRPHKSMYLPAGYKELRDVQGKPTDNIKANYSGSTMAAYQQQVTDTAVLQGMTDARSSKVRKGLEKQKKQDIYKPSPIEIEDYKKIVLSEFRDLNLKLIAGVSV